jgi:hypothetical protein
MEFFFLDLNKLNSNKINKMSFASLIANISEKYPKPEAFNDKNVSYGTAGFRTK